MLSRNVSHTLSVVSNAGQRQVAAGDALDKHKVRRTPGLLGEQRAGAAIADRRFPSAIRVRAICAAQPARLGQVAAAVAWPCRSGALHQRLDNQRRHLASVLLQPRASSPAARGGRRFRRFRRGRPAAHRAGRSQRGVRAVGIGLAEQRHVGDRQRPGFRRGSCVPDG